MSGAMRRRWLGDPVVMAAAAAVLALGIAACTTGAPVPGSSSASAPATTPATTVANTPAETASPSSMPGDDSGGRPPTADLAGLADGGTVTGDLGSFTWDGMASDGPWIVQPAGSRATTLAHLTVGYAGGALPGSWTASWAPISGDAAGTPIPAGEGHGRVAIQVPGAAGSWSLRLTASFGEGRSGTWFWRLAVGP